MRGHQSIGAHLGGIGSNRSVVGHLSVKVADRRSRLRSSVVGAGKERSVRAVGCGTGLDKGELVKLGVREGLGLCFVSRLDLSARLVSRSCRLDAIQLRALSRGDDGTATGTRHIAQVGHAARRIDSVGHRTSIAAHAALDGAAKGLRARDGLVARVHHSTCSGDIRSVGHISRVLDEGELIKLSVSEGLGLCLVSRLNLSARLVSLSAILDEGELVKLSIREGLGLRLVSRLDLSSRLISRSAVFDEGELVKLSIRKGLGLCFVCRLDLSSRLVSRSGRLDAIQLRALSIRNDSATTSVAHVVQNRHTVCSVYSVRHCASVARYIARNVSCEVSRHRAKLHVISSTNSLADGHRTVCD